MEFSAIIFFAVVCCSLVCGLPLSDTYGVPFEKYGAPEERTLNLPEVRPKVVKSPIEGQEILPVFSTPERTEEEFVAPPNSQVKIQDKKNQYSVGFQDSNGTEVKEQGRLISTDNGWEYVIAKTGSYKYLSPEGVEVDVEWVADEKGFRILTSSV